MIRRIGRWWFTNRQRGGITIAQFPNLPIWCIGVCWVARLVVGEGTTPHDVLGWAIRGLWLMWGLDEVTRGVNPWRRALGVGVIVWQIVALAVTS